MDMGWPKEEESKLYTMWGTEERLKETFHWELELQINILILLGVAEN